MPAPYSDPEYLHNLYVVPYDHEAELAAERWRIEQASYAFHENCRRERKKAVARNVWGAMGLTIFMAAFIAGWCLL